MKRELTLPYYEETPYGSKNETFVRKLWHDIDVDLTVIALTDDYAIKKGLVPQERFPWDPEKGIYILHGYHNLHCLVSNAMFLMKMF
jgi:hypothetical protein